MELLRIRHHDFVMTIECTKFDAIWDKAKRNVGEDKLSSTYSWSDGVELVERYLNDQSTSKVILKILLLLPYSLIMQTIRYGWSLRKRMMPRL